MNKTAESNGLKSTNQGIYSEGKLVGNLFNSKQGPFVFDTQDGEFVSLEAISKKYPGYQQMPTADKQPSSAERKAEGKVIAEVERGKNEFDEIDTILKNIEANPELVGFRGDIMASAVTVSQILGNVFGDNGITRLGKQLAGDKKSQAFLDNINNMSEKLLESYIKLRTKAKGSRPIATEIEEIRKLTNLRDWTSSEKILANVSNLRRRLKEDLKVIEQKKDIITGEGASTKSRSGTTRSGIKWTVK